MIDLARLRRMLAPVRHPDAISVPEHYLWMWLSLQHRTLELLEAELLRAEDKRIAARGLAALLRAAFLESRRRATACGAACG